MRLSLPSRGEARPGASCTLSEPYPATNSRYRNRFPSIPLTSHLVSSVLRACIWKKKARVLFFYEEDLGKSSR